MNSRAGEPSAKDPETALLPVIDGRACSGGWAREHPDPGAEGEEAEKDPRGIPELLRWVVRLLCSSRRRRALMFVEVMSKAFQTLGAGQRDESTV
jgi:hypothetical protein